MHRKKHSPDFKAKVALLRLSINLGQKGSQDVVPLQFQIFYLYHIYLRTAIEALKGLKTVNQIASETEVNPTQFPNFSKNIFDGRLCLWHEAVELIQILEEEVAFCHAAWHPLGDKLAVGSESGEIFIYSIQPIR